MKFSQKLIVLFLGIMIPASIAISYCVYTSNLKSLRRTDKAQTGRLRISRNGQD